MQSRAVVRVSASNQGRTPRPGICWKSKESHSQAEERLVQGENWEN